MLTRKGRPVALARRGGRRATFATIANRCEVELHVLRTAAASGDAGAFAAAYGQTGQACGTCHRPYRAPAR